MTPDADIIVVGAGVIGVSAALALRRRGLQVTMIDRHGVASGASAGNAGAFAFSDIIPLATPGILRKAPLWLLDPLGPLSIPPRYALRIAPWLLRFWRASWRDNYAAAIAAQAALNRLSRDALQRQIADEAVAPLLRHSGQLQLYHDASAIDRHKLAWEARAREGIAFHHLRSAAELAEIQPGISSAFSAGTFVPEWMSATDPALYVRHLAERFHRAGGRIATAEIARLQVLDNAVVLHDTAGTTHRARQVVVASGAWSHQLARTLGDRLPLETERGYNTTLPAGAFDLRTQLTFSDHGFVVTSIGEGIRVGGAVELGGLRLPPDYRRAKVLLNKAQRFLPGLDPSGGTQWMGFRPSMPDSLPVVGCSPRHAQVIYAFGHGHLGLTQAPATARLVADLATGTTPPIDMSPYRANRF